MFLYSRLLCVFVTTGYFWTYGSIFARRSLTSGQLFRYLYFWNSKLTSPSDEHPINSIPYDFTQQVKLQLSNQLAKPTKPVLFCVFSYSRCSTCIIHTRYVHPMSLRVYLILLVTYTLLLNLLQRYIHKFLKYRQASHFLTLIGHQQHNKTMTRQTTHINIDHNNNKKNEPAPCNKREIRPWPSIEAPDDTLLIFLHVQKFRVLLFYGCWHLIFGFRFIFNALYQKPRAPRSNQRFKT